MAAPHVAGAIALLHNADNSLNAKNIINIIKTKGRTNSSLMKYVKNGVSLSLSDTGIDKRDNTSNLNKKANPMTVKGTTTTIKYASLLRKSRSVKAVAVKKAKGTVKYAVKSGSGNLVLDKKTGDIIVKKGIKRGKYSAAVYVTSSGTNTYKPKTVSAKIKIIIK